MKIGELFMSLGFDVDSKKLDEFNQKIKGGMTDMLKLSAAAAGALYAVNSFVAGGIASATAMRNFRDETGESVEALQKWQVAAQLTNSAIDAEAVLSSFRKIKKGLTDIEMGGGPSGAYALLGMETHGKTVPQILEEVRASLKNSPWSKAQTISFMEDVGIDPRMLQALQLTDEEFNKLADNRFLSEEQRGKLVSLGNSISDLTQKLSLLKDTISADYANEFTGSIEGAGEVVSNLATGFMEIVKAIKSAWDGMGELKTAFKIAGAAIMVVMSPILAVVTALAVAINDIGAFLRGKDSYLGDFSNWLSGMLNGEPKAQPRVEHLLGDMGSVSNSNKTIIQNNTMNINSTADAMAVANAINGANQSNLNRAAAQINMGAAR